MKFAFKKHKVLIICIVLLVLFSVYYFTNMRSNVGNIGALTDNWINAVTINNNPKEIAKMFCNDGNLVGTVSQTIRRGPDIERYFDYFANLPGIKVLKKSYDIEKVSNNVYLNTAFITWTWDTLGEPIVARMSFLYRDGCIFQLHSSSLPDLNTDLKKF